jgi:hypothetical protein
MISPCVLYSKAKPVPFLTKLQHAKSDTPARGGGLMSWAASKAVALFLRLRVKA